ncbi:MAG: SPOR domain-containing protein [Gemmatimonadales bacterium]|jgi:cell division protein FtsN|nr:SPOR domain-containing protein [Gemmatimonadales bacterium]
MPHVVIPEEAEEREEARRGHRARLLAVAALLALALAAGGLLWWRTRRPESGSSAGGELRTAELPTPPPAIRGDSAAARRAPFRVQVGTYSDRGQAADAARRLEIEGWNTEILEGAPGDDPRFRVHVGPFTERERAERVARVLRQTLGREMVLVEVR